jgi:hypothetical protein
VSRAQPYARPERAGKHLVTLASAAENAVVLKNIDFDQIWRPNGLGQTAGPWNGHYQPKCSAEPAGGRRWLTSEAFAYSDWSPAEPNNSKYNENGGCYWDSGGGHSAAWDDIARAPKLGYPNG